MQNNEETFKSVKQTINQEMSALRNRYRKTSHIFFQMTSDDTGLSKTLWFKFKHSGTYFKYFICALTMKEDTLENKEECYNELLISMLNFIIHKTHIKMIKDPIKALGRHNLQLGI